jgi:hypothetical protein
MVNTVFKGVWFLSLIGLLVVYFYVYASLPEQVIVYGELDTTRISKELLFYLSIAFIAIWNVLVYLVPSLMKPSPQFIRWLLGLIICLNLFFLIAVSYINVFNSNERYDYQSIGIVIYGVLGLLAVWASGWPIYLLFQKITLKKSV